MSREALSVIGFIDDAVFQQCTEAAAYLNKEYADQFSITVKHLLPLEYEMQRNELLRTGGIAEEGNDVAALRVLVVDVDQKAVTGAAFIQRILNMSDFRLFDLPDGDPNSYRALAIQSYKKSLRARGNVYTWISVKINDVPQPRIVFELFGKKLPRTVANFVHLCKGDLPDTTDENKNKIKLSYKGSQFFRIVQGGWVQAGDIVPPYKGNGGYSCYGPSFPDESFDIPHDAKGTLGMCNDGEGTNASAFYITLSQSSWMNRSYVAFGRVVEGLSTLDAIAAVETRHNQAPAVPVVIEDCGEVSLD
jgi:cyclophilin family peptidyl-prolyl cis-trans isomerase